MMKIDCPLPKMRLKSAAALSCVLLAPVILRPAMAAEHTGDLPVFDNDFGETGLMQTPTARRDEVGNFSFTFSHIKPYDHYNFHFQPFSWMRAGFRYTEISDRKYKASHDKDLDFLDKSFDVTFFLMKEGRYKPDLALGFRDVGGTGLFSSEYLVANKRFHNFDFSFGIAWGYIGNRGDFGNPAGQLASRFKHRRGGTQGTGGSFSTKSWFTGKPALFGGIQYTTPWQPLSFQVEYEGNDYNDEPSGNPISQKFPVNIGARLRLNDNITFSAAFERGKRAMLGGTVRANLASITQAKSDPAPVIPEKTRDNGTEDWSEVADKLDENAGIAVTRITRQGDELVIDGVPKKYRKMAQAEMRGNRILHNASGKDIKAFRYRLQNDGGLYLREDKLPRDPLPKQPIIVDPISPFADLDYRHDVVSSNTDDEPARGEKLYSGSPRRFDYSIGPGLNYNYGGPDGLVYQALAQASGEFKTDRNGWLSGTMGYSLFDNTNHIDYEPTSHMHRVRTDATQYMKHTNLGIYNLQYTRTARLSDNVFAMGYFGLLEQMFGGVGGEILYRPFNSNVAFGADLNWVKKRDFRTKFDFRSYSTLEGQATAYVDTGIQDILAKVSAGRFLARDYGARIDLSKRFESGVTLGAYAVFTTAHGHKYGEGSFNKGIYLRMPLDIFFTKSSRSDVKPVYTPLTRDGGAMLNRRYELYDETGDRNLNRYWQGFKRDE